MAWSDAARAAALAARKASARAKTYTATPGAAHVGRGTMAKWIKEARSTGLRGPGKSVAAVKAATQGTRDGTKAYFTNVKGAHNVDQGLGGKVWRAPKGVPRAAAPKGGVPKWAAKSVGYTHSQRKY